MDPDNTAPHWVVTATEFQINTYRFHLWDTNPNCYWDSITWEFENPGLQWLLEPDTTTQPKGQNCTLYVMEHVDDTVWLSAKAYNRCAPQGIASRYWFVCSFHGLDESILSSFSVLPNPNNGQMTLNFQHLTGKIGVKVYDMRGMIIDDFQTTNYNDSSTYHYDMKSKANGVYFFVVTSKEGILTKKVVIFN